MSGEGWREWAHRQRGWRQQHRGLTDASLAGALALVALLELVVGREKVEGPWWAQAVCFGVMTASVALRRRAVVVAAAACGAALVVQEMLGPAPVVSGFLALLIVLYSGGAHGHGRQDVAALVVMLAALTVYPVTDRLPASLAISSVT